MYINSSILVLDKCENNIRERHLKWNSIEMIEVKPSSYISMNWEWVGDLTTILVNCDQSHEPLSLFSALLAFLKKIFVLNNFFLFKKQKKMSQKNAKNN